tara:strand:- start:270 stop:488 length:219 start_codon:yes stop_codon:yes gene_type:complete
MTFEQWYNNHLINNGTTFKSVLEGAYQAGWDAGDRQMVGCLTDKWQPTSTATVCIKDKFALVQITDKPKSME